jgi:hypothetical protein
MLVTTQHDPGPSWLAVLAWRLLAVLDAVLGQTVAIWWITQQGRAFALLAMPVVVVLAIWALRRAGHAVFEPETYSWMTLKLGGLALMLLGVGLIVQLVRAVL